LGPIEFLSSSDIVSFRKDNHIAMKLLMATKKKKVYLWYT